MLLVSIIIYIFLQYSILSSSLCSNTKSFSPWAINYYFATGYAFFMAACQQAMNILKCYKLPHLYHGLLYFTAFTISMIAGSSNILTYAYSYGVVCEDVLGVASPPAQWSEWLICVPLMVYVTIAVEGKERELTRGNVSTIILMFFCIFFGFILNFDLSFNLGIFVVNLSALCFVGSSVHYFLRRTQSPRYDECPQSPQLSMADARISQEEALVKSTKHRYLLRLLLVVFPLFPAVYLMAYLKVLDRDQVIVAFGTAGIIAKLLFIRILVDAKIGLSQEIDAQQRSKKSADESRNLFLRYVFHELRNPLHAMAMGLDVVRHDGKESEIINERKEAIHMMRGATNFMSDTLEHVLSVHKIEEGLFEILKAPFAVEDIISNAIRATRGESESKNLCVSIENRINSAVGEHHLNHLIGDESKLGTALVDFLSRAIKRSPEGSSIRVTIDKNCRTENFQPELQPFRNRALSLLRSLVELGKYYCAIFRSLPILPFESLNFTHAGTIREITIKISDNGRRISQKDMDGMLSPYSQIRPDEAQLEQGRDTGLWLVIAREVIVLHGGLLIAECDPECEGNIFGFTIPFQLAPRSLFGLQSEVRRRTNSFDIPQMVINDTFGSYSHIPF